MTPSHGDPAENSWFQDEINRHYGPLLRLCNARCQDIHLAQDLAQTAIAKALDKKESFDRSRDFWPWLVKIALNTLYTERRRPRIFGVSSPEDIEELQVDDLPPDHQLVLHEDRQGLRMAIEALPDHLRETVMLRFFDGLSGQEIADVLAIQVGTVWSRLNSAHKKLKQALT